MTQTIAPLAQQIAVTQGFMKMVGLRTVPGRTSWTGTVNPIDVTKVRDSYNRAFSAVMGVSADEARSEFPRNSDEIREKAPALSHALWKHIDARIGGLAAKPVSREVLEREDVEREDLLKLVGEGFLTELAVEDFLEAAASHLWSRLDDAGIRPGDVLVNAARFFFEDLEQIYKHKHFDLISRSLFRPFLKAVEVSDHETFFTHNNLVIFRIEVKRALAYLVFHSNRGESSYFAGGRLTARQESWLIEAASANFPPREIFDQLLEVAPYGTIG